MKLIVVNNYIALFWLRQLEVGSKRDVDPLVKSPVLRKFETGE